MLILRLVLAIPLLCLMLVGVGFLFYASLIQITLLIAAGIFLLIGVILREIPTVGLVASAPFFTARWVLEQVMLLRIDGISLSANTHHPWAVLVYG